MSVSRVTLNSWSKLDFRDPEHDLIEFRNLEVEISNFEMDARVRHLRTRSLRPFLEMRQAALFSYGMSMVQYRKVYYSMVEAQDYDFVTARMQGENLIYCPVQLKEWVPSDNNPDQSFVSILEALEKYVDSGDLCVAIHMNRQTRFDPSSINFPNLQLAGLWVYGGANKDQDEWVIFGDLLTGSLGQKFIYPQFNSKKE